MHGNVSQLRRPTVRGLCLIAAAVGSLAVQGQPPEPGLPRSGPVERPLRTLGLAQALAAESVRGEALQTPRNLAAERMASAGAERHHIAGPWTYAHPSRNTFPFRHQPLYFEHPALERCGQTHGCLTEVASVAHFAARIPALPLLVAATPPHSLVPALPDCPAGGRFAWHATWPRLTPEAVAWQAAVTVGLVFLIP